MISLSEIERTILDLEQRDTTYVTCEKLASLYIVRDHLKERIIEGERIVNPDGESEFIKACSGKSDNVVFPVLDELMETLKVIYPRAYESVLHKLSE